MTTYYVDGVVFPKDPIRVKWTNPTIGVRGNATPARADVWSLEMDLGFLELTEKTFFYNAWRAAGTHVVTVEHPQDDRMVTITGAIVDDFQQETMDVPDFEQNCKLVFSNLRFA